METVTFLKRWLLRVYSLTCLVLIDILLIILVSSWIQQYKENPSLGRWVDNQKTQHKKLYDGKPTHLTIERIQLLVGIGFQFRWEEAPFKSTTRDVVLLVTQSFDILGIIRFCNLLLGFSEHSLDCIFAIGSKWIFMPSWLFVFDTTPSRKW